LTKPQRTLFLANTKGLTSGLWRGRLLLDRVIILDCCDAHSTSATGHSRPMHSVPVPINVRCYSNSDIIVRRSEVTPRAKNRLMHRNKIGKTQRNNSAIGRHDAGGFGLAPITRDLRLCNALNLRVDFAAKRALTAPTSKALACRLRRKPWPRSETRIRIYKTPSTLPGVSFESVAVATWSGRKGLKLAFPVLRKKSY
jgi:hypothetical protein